jgi:alkylation response protein AidB-like acyl-CoA dehydrogenase
MIKKLLKKITGIQAIEDAKAKAEQLEKEAVERTAAAQREAEQARQEAEIAKMTPKERATIRGEPWVSVLDTHVNKENIRNGFFELDWNEPFIVQLRQAGYGFEGDPDEEIVDRWFRDIVRNMFADDGLDTTRGAGYINVVPISKGKSEVS